jgi:cell division protein ZapB
MASPGARRDGDELKRLESRIDELISECQRLRRDNEQLRSERGDLNEKHTRLMEKTRIARERIEAMIGRLKALERT